MYKQLSQMLLPVIPGFWVLLFPKLPCLYVEIFRMLKMLLDAHTAESLLRCQWDNYVSYL